MGQRRVTRPIAGFSATEPRHGDGKLYSGIRPLNTGSDHSVFSSFPLPPLSQDRWLQLVGEESGEVRVRLAAVPGAADSDAVQQMVLQLTAQSLLGRASTPTLQVGVERSDIPQQGPAFAPNYTQASCGDAGRQFRARFNISPLFRLPL